MPLIVLALVALIVVIAFLRLGAGRDPGFLMRLARPAGIAVLVVLTLFFALTERWIPAVFLAGIGWSLYTRGRAVPEGWFPRDEREPPPRDTGTRMPAAEALKILGLPPGADADAVRAAHKRLILQNHPDRGGSDYLAAKINEAKDVLLGD
jgi:hypothetical protein